MIVSKMKENPNVFAVAEQKRLDTLKSEDETVWARQVGEAFAAQVFYLGGTQFNEAAFAILQILTPMVDEIQSNPLLAQQYATGTLEQLEKLKKK